MVVLAVLVGRMSVAVALLEIGTQQNIGAGACASSAQRGAVGCTVVPPTPGTGGISADVAVELGTAVDELGVKVAVPVWDVVIVVVLAVPFSALHQNSVPPCTPGTPQHPLQFMTGT